jgi:hypothetical protein
MRIKSKDLNHDDDDDDDGNDEKHKRVDWGIYKSYMLQRFMVLI